MRPFFLKRISEQSEITVRCISDGEKKKFKIEKIGDEKIAVEIKKDHNRPPMPAPTSVHKSKKDYDRKKKRKEIEEEWER